MKEVVRSLDVGFLPQIGLVAFVLAFLVIVIYAFRLSRGQVSEFSDLPFDEAVPADDAARAPGQTSPPKRFS